MCSKRKYLVWFCKNCKNFVKLLYADGLYNHQHHTAPHQHTSHSITQHTSINCGVKMISLWCLRLSWPLVYNLGLARREDTLACGTLTPHRGTPQGGYSPRRTLIFKKIKFVQLQIKFAVFDIKEIVFLVFCEFYTQGNRYFPTKCD
jgi:hypothetical protein